MQRGWLRFAIGVTAAFAVGWLAYDGYARLDTPVIKAAARLQPAAKVSATVRIESLRFDSAVRAIRGRMVANLRGELGAPQLTSATLLWPNGNGESINQRAARNEFTAFSEVDPNKARTPTADLRLDIEIVPTRVRSLLLYPFDTYAVPLRFEMCVTSLNDGRGECLGPNVSLTELLVTSEAEFEIAPTGDGDVILSRLGFVRVASLIFLIAASAFFALVLWVPPTNAEGYFLELFGKLLGFLGVLGVIRTFLVPRSITIFPLLIDYISLVLFVGVFAMTGIRMIGMRKIAEKEHEWVD